MPAIEHAVLAPSSAARRMACPGSRALEAAYPETEESPHAAEGHAAHWVASELIKSNFSAPVGSLAPNGEVVTQEMVDGANMYRDEIDQIISASQTNAPSGCFIKSVEERVNIYNINAECWGTPDFWLYNGRSLYILDYKFGHKFVEVFENWQLLEYAAGVINYLRSEFTGFDDFEISVNFKIIQPRNYHSEGPVRSWYLRHASDLRGYFNQLEVAEHAAMQPDALCRPSPECSHCLGRHACRALQTSALTAVDVSKASTPLDLSPHALGNELRYLEHAAKLLDARITGLSGQAFALIKSGERVPGYTVEPTKSRERWARPVDEILLLGEIMGVQLTKPPVLITPKQAIDAGLDESLLKTYAETPVGALKLVQEKLKDSKKAFSN